MSGYLLSIVGIVLLSAVLSAVLPGGKTGKLIRGMAKLACLVVILAPVLKFFAGGEEPDFPLFSSETVIQTDGTFIDYCSTERVKSAENALAEKLSEVFAVRAEVKLEWEYCDSLTGTEYMNLYAGKEIRITKAVLTDAEGVIGEEVRQKMEEYVAENYGCEAEFVG